MIRMKARLRKSVGIAATAWALSLAGCLGGTGTDTENGVTVLVTVRVLAQDSAPASGISFTVFEVYTRADSLLDNPVVGGDTVPLVTDGGGFVTVLLKRAGSYMAQGSNGDTILFLDTLKPSYGRKDSVGVGSNSALFQVENAVHAKGRVRLLSGYRPDTGTVMLQGTKRQSPIRKGGAFDLGWIPPSAEKLTLRVVYSASPTDTSAAAECVKSGTGGGNSTKLRLTQGEIVVDDLNKKSGCPVATLP